MSWEDGATLLDGDIADGEAAVGALYRARVVAAGAWGGVKAAWDGGR